MDENPLTLVAVWILLSAGATCLFHALARLWEIARLRTTPLSKIGAAPAGWAAFSGVVRAHRELEDPLSQRPCLWWRCVVQGFDNERRQPWYDVKRVACHEPFHLDDGTGTIVVAPQGAEVHVGDLEERIVELTAANHHDLAPLLKAWGIKFTGCRIPLVRNLGLGILRTLRIKVQTLHGSERISVVGYVSPCPESAGDGKTPRSDRLVIGKRRGRPFVIATRVPSKLPLSMEFRAACVAFVGLLSIGTGGVLAWLLKTWGFWPSLAVMRPLSAAAAVAGLGVGWRLKRGGKPDRRPPRSGTSAPRPRGSPAAARGR